MISQTNYETKDGKTKVVSSGKENKDGLAAEAAEEKETKEENKKCQKKNL